MRISILIGIVIIGFLSNVTTFKLNLIKPQDVLGSSLDSAMGSRGSHPFTKLKELGTKVHNIVKSAIDLAIGSVKGVPKYLTPSELIDLGKQSIVGCPVELILSVFNAICSAAQNTNSIHPKDKPDKNEIAFLLMTPCENFSYPIDQAGKMWENPAFSRDKKVVLLATGWNSNINSSDPISAMSKAYFCRGDVNFIAVDTARLVDTVYSWSALNTEGIGELIGTGLSLLKDKIAPENIHLIGHSLGAHIVGAAARTFHELTNKLVRRITGLDPARPCFNEGEKLTGLMRGDALYVDIIHTNPGNLGILEPIGDADFYPGGLKPIINGCLEIACSHARSWKLYTESVYPGHENSFPSVRCNSQYQLLNGNCRQSPVPMGFLEKDPNTKGSFFLKTRRRAPYGKPQGKPIDRMCGVCKNKP